MLQCSPSLFTTSRLKWIHFNADLKHASSSPCSGSKDYQLATWSRDQTLRMWRVDCQLQRVGISADQALLFLLHPV